MIQRQTRRYQSFKWLAAALGLIASGCQPAAKPIPPVERPNQQSVPASSPDTQAATPNAAEPGVAQGKSAGALAETVAPVSPNKSEPTAARTPPKPAAPARPTEQVSDDAGGDPWLPGQTSMPFESWEAIYRNAQRIGVTQYKYEMADKSRYRLTMTTHMATSGVAKPVKRTVQVETVEQPNGLMESFSESIKIGPGETRVDGVLIGRNLRLESKGSAGHGTKQVALQPGSWGPQGLHQLLMRKPMKPQETRVAHVFLAQSHQVAKVTLTAGDAESTTCPAGLLEDVIPIEAKMQLEKEGIQVRLWADRQGYIQKTIWPKGLNFSSFRVSTDEGQRMLDENEAQTLLDAHIVLSEEVKRAAGGDKVVYIVGSSQSDPYQLFSSQGNQLSKSATAFEAKVTVQRSSLEGPLAVGIGQPKPGQECSQPSLLVNSDAPGVMQLAASLAADERVPGQVATQLTAGLVPLIKWQKFDATFQRASDVLQTHTGDAGDGAVLLAALLRCRDIPARLASGIRLQATENGQRFVYHMWTEAWIGDRWLALDASTGQLADCGYIKFLETPLEGSNPYRAMLPVLSVLDKLKISLEK